MNITRLAIEQNRITIVILVVILFVGRKVLPLICHNPQKTLHVDVREKKKRMMVNLEKDNPLVQLR